MPINTFSSSPLPVCGFTRSRRDRCFKPDADYGQCAAKNLTYYGFKLGLRVSHLGMITYFPLLPARPHDIQFLDELVENFVGVVPADKGFIDEFRQALLAEQGVLVMTPPRKRMTMTVPPLVLKVRGRIRKCVETVASPLVERFAVERIRVHDLWHFQHRLIRKVLAHTVGVFGRPPLDLDGLLEP